MSVTLGIDVSKATLDLVLLDGEHKTYQQFNNTKTGHKALLKWLRSTDTQPHICLESTGRYSDAIALVLVTAGYTVSKVNPAHIKYFRQFMGKANKTDRHDAYLIALFCQHSEPKPWCPPEIHHERLKQKNRHLKFLKNTRQRFCNSLASGVTDSYVVADLEAQIKHLDQQIKALEKHIRNFIQQHPDLHHAYHLLTSIPYVGNVTATTFLAEIGSIDRFDQASALASFIGITPVQFESGTSVKRPSHISKRGNVHLRAVLYLPAVNAKNNNVACRPLAQRLLAKGKCEMEVIIAVMHKLIRIMYGVLKSGKPFDPDFEVQFAS